MNTLYSKFEPIEKKLSSMNVNDSKINQIRSLYYLGSMGALSTVTEVFASDLSEEAKGKIMDGLIEEIQTQLAGDTIVLLKDFLYKRR